MILVSDASPLVALAAVGRFDVLPALYGVVVIPQAVYDEVAVRGVGEPGAAEVQAAPWVEVAAAVPSPDLLRTLDRGEAEAIALALARGANRLLIDERRGRREAEARGLRVIGTVGVLVEAARHGLVPDLDATLGCPPGGGIYLDDALRQQALASARRP